MEQLLANDEFKKHLKLADKQPLIVAGDFNAPSHLDWSEETKFHRIKNKFLFDN
jgi:endonuclease/exonuclease/phosphatase (EEP) superfamily protein YafD